MPNVQAKHPTRRAYQNAIRMPHGFTVNGPKDDLINIVKVVFECDSIEAMGIYQRLAQNASRAATGQR